MARRTLPNEVGTYNPYTREYEHAGTSEENAEDFQIEHADESKTNYEMNGQEVGKGELLAPNEQPETFNPYTRTWHRAGYPEVNK